MTQADFWAEAASVIVAGPNPHAASWPAGTPRLAGSVAAEEAPPRVPMGSAARRALRERERAAREAGS